MNAENNTSGAAKTRRASRKTTTTAAPAEQPAATPPQEPAETSPAAAPAPAPAAESTPAANSGPSRNDPVPAIDFELRRKAREWPQAQVLEHLHKLSEQVAASATVVGQWLWVRFNQPPGPDLRASLSQLGFHWSARRQCWQHPCGHFGTGTGGDPVAKYGSRTI